MSKTELDQYNVLDPSQNPRDYRPSEVHSTTALRKCVDAYKAWSTKPSDKTAKALAEARAQFVELSETMS